MAIIRFEFTPDKLPEGAQNVQASHRGAGYQLGQWDETGRKYVYVDHAGPTGLWTYETHIGLCLKDYERNGYDDSDFHMVVWNPETQSPEDICFASTRGWSYPSYNSYVDATPEVRAAHEAWIKRRQRVYDVQSRRSASKRRAELAREFGVRPSAVKRLEAAYRKDDLERVIKLAKQVESKRLKSEFRRKLAQQVVAWLRDPSPQYATPLSPKQLMYI
jgi:hypothetical protein